MGSFNIGGSSKLDGDFIAFLLLRGRDVLAQSHEMCVYVLIQIEEI